MVPHVIKKRQPQKQKSFEIKIEQRAYDYISSPDLPPYISLTSILETYYSEEQITRPYLVKGGIKIIL